MPQIPLGPLDVRSVKLFLKKPLMNDRLDNEIIVNSSEMTPLCL